MMQLRRCILIGMVMPVLVHSAFAAEPVSVLTGQDSVPNLIDTRTGAGEGLLSSEGEPNTAPLSTGSIVQDAPHWWETLPTDADRITFNPFLPIITTPQGEALLADIRASSPIFALDSKNPAVVWAARQGVAEGPEQNSVVYRDDSPGEVPATSFLGVALIILIAGVVLYLRAQQNRNKIREAIRERRAGLPLHHQRRSSSRRSRSLNR